MNFTPPFPKGLEQVLSQSIGGGGGECDGGGSNGEGGEGAGGGGLGGGSGGGEGEGGGDGEGSLQQASLQFAESFFFLHNFVHFFFCFCPLHAFSTFFLSFFLHVFLSLSASQFFGDGVGAVPLPLFISGPDSIVRMSTTASAAVNGATAQTQSSTQKTESHLSVPLSAVLWWESLFLLRVAFFRGGCLLCWSISCTFPLH